MERPEDASVTVSFKLTARFPIPYHGQHDGHRWMRQWERHIEPRVLRAILHEIRTTEGWRATPHTAEDSAPIDDVTQREIVISVEHHALDAREGIGGAELA
jgi:hypothetical protein